MPRIAVIGAGAAGCFGAIRLSRMLPEAEVHVYEVHARPLAKVAITGGGRCNLTNSFKGIGSLSEAYPRGHAAMKRLLKVFSQQDTWRWFTQEGVPLLLQDDECVFPRSQDAGDIVRALTRALSEAGVKVHTGYKVTRVEPGFRIFSPDGETTADAVLVTTGGAQKGLPFLEALPVDMVPPVPSLFTFNISDTALTSLMGLVVEASVGLAGTPFRARGPLLVTDWGVSGPAVLKLSSHAARYLAENAYRGTLTVNWTALPEAEVRSGLENTAASHPQKLLTSVHSLPSRLWEHLLRKAGLRESLRWSEIGSKGMNRLTAVLTADTYPISGKCRFRDEFVTCGGVALSGINLNTLESKAHPGLFFAGEVLDIDAITGGFNLQAAWTTGYVAATAIARKLI